MGKGPNRSLFFSSSTSECSESLTAIKRGGRLLVVRLFGRAATCRNRVRVPCGDALDCWPQSCPSFPSRINRVGRARAGVEGGTGWPHRANGLFSHSPSMRPRKKGRKHKKAVVFKEWLDTSNALSSLLRVNTGSRRRNQSSRHLLGYRRACPVRLCVHKNGTGPFHPTHRQSTTPTPHSHRTPTRQRNKNRRTPKGLRQ